MKPRSTHTAFKKGTKVLVIFRDKNRENIVDKFLDKKSRYIILEENGKININEVRSINIYKEAEHDRD